MSKSRSLKFKHKNTNNSESNGTSNLKFSHKVPYLYAHHPAKFQPSTPVVQKLSPKRFNFSSFQDPWTSSFQDHQILQNITLVIYIRNFLSRPLPRSIEISFQDHCTLHYTLQGSNPLRTQNSDHFKTLILVYFQDHGRRTTHFFSHQSLTGMQRTSNRHLMSGRVRSH